MDQDIQKTKQELIDKVRDNYVSVALGILVLLVAVTLMFRSNEVSEELTDLNEDTTMEQQMRTHVVQPGESLSSIARDQLGSMDYTDELIEANDITNPNVVEVGTELVLPNIGTQVSEEAMESEEEESVEKEAMKETGETSDTAMATQTIEITGDTYTTVKGDYLWDIAKRAYGDGNMYTAIIEANTLRNPDHLEEGTVLKLPRPQTK